MESAVQITQEANSQGTRLLGKCAGCSLPLPLRLPDVHERSYRWECVGCGKVYEAILLEDWPAEFQRNIRRATSGSQQKEAPAARQAEVDSAA